MTSALPTGELSEMSISTWGGQYVTAHTLVALMATLQVLWLGLIWWSNTAPHPEKLLPVALYTVMVMVIVNRLPRTMLDASLTTVRTLVGEESRLWQFAVTLLLGVGSVYAYYFYGWPDEQHVVAAARIVADQGISPFFQNYVQIPWLGQQHPPLVVLLYGVALRWSGGELLAIRLVSLGFALVTLILTYHIGRELATRTVGVMAAVWLLCMPFFFRLAPAALTDMPVTCCFVLSLFLALRLRKNPSVWLATLVGISIGIGLLCKYTMVFVYPIVLVVWGSNDHPRQLTSVFVVAFLVSFAVFAPWLGYAIHKDIFVSQQSLLSRYARNATMTTEGRWWLLSVLAFRLPSGIGVANLPILFLGIWQLLSRRSQGDYFLIGWILIVSVPLILTLPGPRYFFPMFPALAIVMAYGLQHYEGEATRSLLAALLFASAALYLFVDWPHAAGDLFIR